MSAPGWDNFWKDQRQSFYAVMRIATGYFTRQLEQQQYIQPGHKVFDFGCGPGFLSDDLAAKKVNITGADINEFFLNECRKNHPGSLFITITTDTAANTEILREQLQGKRFDRIILLSVIQYLKQTSELHAIVGMLRDYLKPAGLLIIADVIDAKTSSARDAMALFRECMRRGRIGAFIGFIGYLLFSDYRKISKSMQLLQVEERVIAEVAGSTGLAYKQVKGLTMHPTRKNYVFYLP